MKKIHYAWYVCAGCAIVLFCTSGLSINAFSIYQPYILKLNGFTNAQTSTIITFRSAFSFLSMLIAGAFYKKVPQRLGVGIACMLVAVSLALFGLATEYWMYCLAGAVMGFAYGIGTMIPIAVILANWFTEKRNTALGVVGAATGLSTLGIPSLISSSIVSRGLRATFLTEAAIVAVLAVISFLLIRNKPEDKGVSAYGSVSDAKARSMSGIGTVKQDWLLLTPVYLLLGAVMSVSYSHLTVLMTGEGYSAATAAAAIAISGVTLLVFKLLYGRLGDSIGNYRSNYIFCTLFVAGYALLCVMKAGTAVLYAGIFIYSVGMCSHSVGLTAWTADFSSAKNYAWNVQVSHILYSAGTMLFSSLPGVLADRFNGSYVPAYLTFLVLELLTFAAVQLTFVRIRRRRAEAE